jgi:hypothetical protein
MAIIFSFFLLFVIALIAAVVLGIICAVVAWLIVRKRIMRFKWLVVLSAALTPSLFIGSEFVLGMIGNFYVSAKKDVDWGFGDYWEAPLTQSYYLYAIDLPEAAYIGNREKSKPSLNKGIVRDLWVSEDSIVVACSAAETYSLVAFYPQEDRDEILLNQVDSLQFIDALKQRNLERNAAMGPNGYFNKKQAEAHREEEPIRHTISFLIPLGLWVLLIWYVRRHSKNSLNQNTEQKSNL